MIKRPLHFLWHTKYQAVLTAGRYKTRPNSVEQTFKDNLTLSPLCGLTRVYPEDPNRKMPAQLAKRGRVSPQNVVHYCIGTFVLNRLPAFRHHIRQWWWSFQTTHNAVTIWIHTQIGKSRRFRFFDKQYMLCFERRETARIRRYASPVSVDFCQSKTQEHQEPYPSTTAYL